MRLQFFSIPVHDSQAATEELNSFLASNRVLSVERELIHDGPNSCWSVCVSFVTGEPPKSAGSKKTRVDYREVLSESDFAIYAKLRQLRKEIAEADGVPPYALFTNEQLAALVTDSVDSLADLQKIDGIGPARVEKYGARFIAFLRAETSSDRKDNEAGNDPT